MFATDAKTPKIEPDLNFLWRMKVLEAVCKRDWHNMRSYLFFNVQKVWRKISDSVCNDFKTTKIQYGFIYFIYIIIIIIIINFFFLCDSFLWW